MQRPFCLLGFGMLLGVFIALFTPAEFVFWPLAALFLLFFTAFFCRKERFRRLFPFFGSAALGACFVILTLSGGCRILRSQPIQKPVPVTLTAVGTLKTSGGRSGYRAEVDYLGETELTGFRQAAVYTDEALPLFEEIETEIIFFPSDRLWDMLTGTDGCCVSACLPKKAGESLKSRPSSRFFLFQKASETIRAAVRRALTQSVGAPYDGILLGTATGDTSLIGAQDLTAFRQAGIAHLFAVSGLHLSVLAGSLLLMLKRLHASPVLSALLTFPVIWAVAVLAGFSPSVLRAAVMLTVSVIALLLNKTYDPANALGLTVAVLLACRPVLAADAGFLLSVSASAGILFFAGPVSKRMHRLIRPRTKPGRAFLSALSVSVCASSAVFPASLFFFPGFSVIAPIANLPAAATAPFAVIFGHLTAVLQLMGAPSGLTAFPAMLAKGAAALLQKIGLLFSSLPGAFYQENSLFLQILVLVSCLFLLAGLWFRPSARQAVSVLTASALVFTACSGVCQIRAQMRDTILIQHSSGGIQLLAISRRRSALLVTSAGSSSRIALSDALADRCVPHLNYVASARTDPKTAAALAQLTAGYPSETLIADGILPVHSQHRAPLTDSEIRLSDRCRIFISDRKGYCSFAVLTDSCSVLILPGGEDCGSLRTKPSFDRTFDYCFCLRSLPRDLNALSFRRVCLCAEKPEEPLPDSVRLMGEGDFTLQILNRQITEFSHFRATGKKTVPTSYPHRKE